MESTATTEQAQEWWEESPCPAWCVHGDYHVREIWPDDRNHISELHEVPCYLVDPFGDGRKLDVVAWRNASDAEPHIRIYTEAAGLDIKLTPAEAAMLAEHLNRLVREVIA